MYQFKPYTERIWEMRERIRKRVVRGDAERIVLRCEALKLYKDVVPIIQKPLVTKYICERVTLTLEDDDYFAGNKSIAYCGDSGVLWPLQSDIEREWTKHGDGLWHNPEGSEVRACISQEDIDTILRVAPDMIMEASRVGDAWLPDGAQEFFDLRACDYGRPGRPGNLITPGHLTPGWQKVVNVGYGAIRAQAQEFMDARLGNVMGNDMSKYIFYKAAALSCEAASTLVRRYALLCRKKINETADVARSSELLKMADNLDWIAENPARTFWEACQAVLLYQLFLTLDGGFPGSAFGRFDQYTWPFLQKDLISGTLTLDDAQELTDAFFLKANTYYGIPGFGKMAQTAGIGNTYQHTTIGGVIPATGQCAVNPVTYMVLETIGRLKLHDPTISLRITKDTPDELWDCALETSKLVGGLPLFQNDDVIIPGLMRELEFELEDARDYSIIACQEIVGSGCDYPAPNGVGAAHAGIFYGIALVMAINNGINPENGRQAPANARSGYLYEMDSIDEVRAAFEKLSDYLLKWYVTINNYAEYLSPYHLPMPGLSISMTGCMEKGMDCSAGGCKYNSYGGTATGLATIADSLSAIKYMCFDKKLCTARELYDAVMTNWEGREPLRQQILSDVPHYGNADPYADEELKWVVDMYYNQCAKCSSQRSKVYKAGMYGAADHIAQGELTWATPDGRRTSDPIADAISPAQGRDKNGPTAVFASSCTWDHTRFMDGMALNLRMHPSVLSREDGISKLRDMTKTYFENGGLECQYNVVDTETMRRAQRDPDEYQNLVVRIAGYSAYFVELSTELQNDLISRSENKF
jgi:formate C-acetyltransferase